MFAAGEDLAEGRLVVSVGRAGGGDTGGETGGQADGEGSDGETTQRPRRSPLEEKRDGQFFDELNLGLDGSIEVRAHSLSIGLQALYSH